MTTFFLHKKVTFLFVSRRSRMRPKRHTSFNLKNLFIITATTFILFLLILRSSDSPSPNQLDPCPCKVPGIAFRALVHYASSSMVAQQTLKEIEVTAAILAERSPCNFLVFGLGHDSLMWHVLNHGGRTVFLEEDPAWLGAVTRKFPMLDARHVAYDGSHVSQAGDLLQAGKGLECTALADPRYSMCQLALRGLPRDVYDTEWDVIMVDAPSGSHNEAPGRMTAIYTAGMMARNRRNASESTDVVVHDVNREVEDRFSREFLCEGYTKWQEGKLRHFVIPSHRDDLDRPFCPLQENIGVA